MSLYIAILSMGGALIIAFAQIISLKKKIDFHDDILKNDIPHLRARIEYYQKKIDQLKKQG
jgi:hypothetical protein